MAKKLKGVVAQFGTKGYGFITGDDGEKYFVHQKNIFNKSRLKANTRVVFAAESSEKGLVATNVELEGGKIKVTSTTDGMSDATIRTLFTIMFVIQAVVVYKVFFTVS